jgi:YD repeat-containing protein
VIESHTYDGYRRGLTASRANGVEAVTVGYPVPPPIVIPPVPPGTTIVLDSNGNLTTYTYTYIQGEPYIISVARPACSSCYPQTSSSYAYDASANLASTVDGNGNLTTYTSDANGNQTSSSTTLANGQVVTSQFTYNNFAEVLTATDPLGNVTTNNYDTKENLLYTAAPPLAAGETSSITAYTYNTNGTLKTVSDPLKNVTTLTYYTTSLVDTFVGVCVASCGKVQSRQCWFWISGRWPRTG